MRYGRTVEDGFLPVFSVSTEDEAKSLIVLACNRDGAGNLYARELATEQTLKNLDAFSTRIDKAHDFLAERGKYECK